MRLRTVFTTLGVAMAAAVVIQSAAPVGRAQGAAAARVPIRLYVFDGGILESDPARYQMTKEDVGVTELSVASYLIVHPKGLLMWDTAAVTDSEWTPTGSPVRQHLVLSDGQDRYVTLTRSLGAQLQAAGHRPSEITYLALSHYHWDHTANANAFAGSTWLVRQIERDAMFAEKVAGTTRPGTYSALKNSRTMIVTADEHDVFGDGTVILKLAAGHTPGHQVLFVNLPQTGPVVLSGDLYHYQAEKRLGKFPTFEFNVDQTRVARAALDTFMTRTKARLWIQHDLTAHTALKKAPEYYQ